MTEPTDPTAPPVLPTATYAVTGATGHLGRLAVDALLRRDVPARNVFALVRDPEKAKDLADLGVGVREADYDRPDTLGPALEGIERLLLVSSPSAEDPVGQHTAVIRAADAADVGFVVYTSILHADDTENVLAPKHADTEDVLQGSGLPFAVARNGWYTENYTARLDDYLAHGEIVGATGDGRNSAATRADYAEAAVSLLTGDIADQQGYWELGGPAFTMAELAATITQVTGTEVTYRDISAEEFADALQSMGMDADTAGFVTALELSAARGELETDSPALENLLGRAPTPLVDAVRAARL
ncbi:NAD(P)-dependent oxidoreductase [Actinomycetospora sp. NBRC 106375]|uniref:SDR family oxidoreductase n=1 Tax=Actinomycetospora sp. NBRC 106375 TaxID=3032207 RepID=UPI0024A55B5C|nr:SDR family oxidoreductase [Actinomycetospora sp. NBRC 106375]GLZ44294.1 NAD(P)-dependent oxidoreductase [Actinomycetospora sp. NBRC 106375]